MLIQAWSAWSNVANDSSTSPGPSVDASTIDFIYSHAKCLCLEMIGSASIVPVPHVAHPRPDKNSAFFITIVSSHGNDKWVNDSFTSSHIFGNVTLFSYLTRNTSIPLAMIVDSTQSPILGIGIVYGRLVAYHFYSICSQDPFESYAY